MVSLRQKGAPLNETPRRSRPTNPVSTEPGSIFGRTQTPPAHAASLSDLELGDAAEDTTDLEELEIPEGA
jgi:hypothetical protein